MQNSDRFAAVQDSSPLQQPYNQTRAMLAITRASLRAVFRSPSAVVFSIGFPFIFILVFGFIGNEGAVSFDIGFAKRSDTLNPIYAALSAAKPIRVIRQDEQAMTDNLEKGRMLAILDIQKDPRNPASYIVNLKSSEAVSPQNLAVFRSAVLSGIIGGINSRVYPDNPTIATINPQVVSIPGRVYRTIDFILPGQLGFSLLSSGIFGVAFLFVSLRQQLVLKRFFATPITRARIVLGEAIARVLFGMMTAVIIVGMGALAFHFTLVHGLITFLEIMVLSLLGLLVFMGFGFVVSGLSRNEASIPPFANLITLPQFLLSGTFFSTNAFPSWLRPITQVLPLTHFNNAMRNIAFEGASLVDCWKEIGILAVWGVAVYALAIKVFKWE